VEDTKSDAQEFRLHAGDRARFACSERSGVDLLILRINIGHRALQNDAHRRGCRPKIVCQRTAVPLSAMPVKLGQRELRSRGGAARKRFIVKLKPTSPEESESGGVVF